MRNNIADALTFFRFPAAAALFVLILNDMWLLAMLVFVAAILSDALDGVAARRWPPKPRWYRKDSHAFDNSGDSLLFFAVIVGLAIKVQPTWLWVLIISVVGSVGFLVLIQKMRPSIAEKFDVAFGWCFGALLLAMLMQITSLAIASSFDALLNGVYFVVASLIVAIKWDRATSRPEVQYNGTW